MLKCVDGSHHFPRPSCYTRFSHLTGRCSSGSHVDGRETKNNVKGTGSKAVKTGWWKRVRVITLSHVNVQTNHRKSYFFGGVIESSVFVARVFVFAQLLTSLCTLRIHWPFLQIHISFWQYGCSRQNNVARLDTNTKSTSKIDLSCQYNLSLT